MSNYIFKIKKFDTDGNRTDSLIKGEFAQFDVVGDEDRGRTYVQTSLGAKAFAWKSETDQLRLDVSTALGSKSGYTTDTLPEDRWTEGVTLNTITDTVQDPYIIDGIVHEGGADRDLVLPEAPFAGIDDELLDDKVNGLNCQQAHEAGDIVVAGNELVGENFEADPSLIWTINSGTWNSTDKDFDFIASTSAGAILKVVDGLVAGQTYIVSFEAYDIIAGEIGAREANVGTYITSISSDGIYTKEITWNNTANALVLETKNGFTGTIDNISVKLKDPVRQAITSTSIGDSIADTSKFQKLDFVTRLDVIYLTATGYNSFKGYHGFTDKELVVGGSDLIASRYGFPKISDGCYEINGEKVTCLQLNGSRLNNLAYNPLVNGLGDRNFSDGNNWESTINVKSNIYECAVNRGTGNGRPDNKEADKVYIKGENGLASYSTHYIKDSEIGSDKGLVGISIFEDKLFYGEYLITETITTASSTLKTLTLGKAKEVNEVLYSTDSGNTWSTETFTLDSINNQITLGNARDYILVSYVAYSLPYVLIDSGEVVKVNKVHEVVYSGDSHSVNSNNLILNQVSNAIQTGNNEVVKSLPITAVDNSTGVFDYVDDDTNTTPTFIKFEATLADGGKAECIWGSANGVIDKTNVWARRY